MFNKYATKEDFLKAMHETEKRLQKLEKDLEKIEKCFKDKRTFSKDNIVLGDIKKPKKKNKQKNNT